jgi:hypothetical protein
MSNEFNHDYEALVRAMRGARGLDKALIESETQYLPAPDSIPYGNSMRVVLLGLKHYLVGSSGSQKI